MTYSEVVKAGLILENKDKYNVSDINKLKQEGYSDKDATFIVKCSATYHDVDYSKTVSEFNTNESKVKRMF